MRNRIKVLLSAVLIVALVLPTMCYAAEDHNIMLTSFPVNYLGTKYTVSVDGTVSAEIKGEGITWVRGTSSGRSVWFGLDNSQGVFPAGSKFWVRWLDSYGHPQEYNQALNNIDNRLTFGTSGRLMILEVGVKESSGGDLSFDGKSAPLYVQIGDDWDTEDIEAIYIDRGLDERIQNQRQWSVRTPSGDRNIMQLTMNHFGQTVAIGEETPLMLSLVKQTQPKTGFVQNMFATAEKFAVKAAVFFNLQKLRLWSFWFHFFR